MSFDLFIFNAYKAPRESVAFLAWYDALTQWNEDIDYNDPQRCGSALRAWFDDAISLFPPLNGPFANASDDSDFVTDYSLDRDFIYACYSWRLMNEATTLATGLAAKHRLGIFHASSGDGLVQFPDGCSMQIPNVANPPDKEMTLEEIMASSITFEIKRPWWKFW
ncbi:MAG: hypothetical protein ACREO1_01580 [Arenimonas sp.]